MKTWTTIIHAIVDKEVKVFYGPRVPGLDEEDAWEYCQRNGLGYCEIDGEYIGEGFMLLKHELN